MDLAAGAQTNLLLFNDATFGGRHLEGATVTRMLVKLWLRSDALTQDNILDWGITKVNADARAAGAFPDPNDFLDRASWLVRDRMYNRQSNLSDGTQWTISHMDLRAQRILRNEEEELHLILNNSGSFVLEWAAYVRVLLKLP